MKKETVRKTVNLDKELVADCEALFARAGTASFSQYTAQALRSYNDTLISEVESPILTKQMRSAIRAELMPITSRLSKGLYRYAVLLDMMCQILAYSQFDGDDRILEYLYKQANARIKRTRGTINIKEILDDGWEEADEEREI